MASGLAAKTGAKPRLPRDFQLLSPTQPPCRSSAAPHTRLLRLPQIPMAVGPSLPGLFPAPGAISGSFPLQPAAIPRSFSSTLRCCAVALLPRLPVRLPGCTDVTTTPSPASMTDSCYLRHASAVTFRESGLLTAKRSRRAARKGRIQCVIAVVKVLSPRPDTKIFSDPGSGLAVFVHATIPAYCVSTHPSLCRLSAGNHHPSGCLTPDDHRRGQNSPDPLPSISSRCGESSSPERRPAVQGCNQD